MGMTVAANRLSSHIPALVAVPMSMIYAGTFETAQEANQAYEAARMVYRTERSKSKPMTNPLRRVKGYKGVFRDRTTGKFEAILQTPSEVEVSGGEHESAEDAAKSYDALARMYLGRDAETNFPPSSDYGGWVPPEVTERRQRIEAKPGCVLASSAVEWHDEQPLMVHFITTPCVLPVI